jgi:hypothetical protein
MNVQDCLRFVKKYFFLTFLHILCHKGFGGVGAPGARVGKKGKKGAGKDKDRRAKTKEQGRKGKVPSI